MNHPNPYEAPRAQTASTYMASVPRTPFVLAAIGAWLASAYWAALTLLIATFGSGSLVSTLMPMVLIGLYAVRGYQLFKGDVAAAQRILLLHAIGGVVAILQMAKGVDAMVMALQGVKVLIHVFGGVTALLAQRAGSYPDRVCPLPRTRYL